MATSRQLLALAAAIAGLQVGGVTAVGWTHPAAAAARVAAVGEAQAQSSHPVGEPSDGRRADPGSFTVADVVAGRVAPEAFDAFWEGQRQAVLRAPCVGDGAGGGEQVVLYVGADARWVERLTAAQATHAATCASQP